MYNGECVSDIAIIGSGDVYISSIDKTAFKLDDVLPLSHTIVGDTTFKRPNRISGEVGRRIADLYLTHTVFEISMIVGKSCKSIEKYLKENKLY